MHVVGGASGVDERRDSSSRRTLASRDISLGTGGGRGAAVGRGGGGGGCGGGTAATGTGTSFPVFGSATIDICSSCDRYRHEGGGGGSRTPKGPKGQVTLLYLASTSC